MNPAPGCFSAAYAVKKTPVEGSRSRCPSAERRRPKSDHTAFDGSDKPPVYTLGSDHLRGSGPGSGEQSLQVALGDMRKRRKLTDPESRFDSAFGDGSRCPRRQIFVSRPRALRNRILVKRSSADAGGQHRCHVMASGLRRANGIVQHDAGDRDEDGGATSGRQRDEPPPAGDQAERLRDGVAESATMPFVGSEKSRVHNSDLPR